MKLYSVIYIYFLLNLTPMITYNSPLSILIRLKLCEHKQKIFSALTQDFMSIERFGHGRTFNTHFPLYGRYCIWHYCWMSAWDFIASLRLIKLYDWRSFAHTLIQIQCQIRCCPLGENLKLYEAKIRFQCTWNLEWN